MNDDCFMMYFAALAGPGLLQKDITFSAGHWQCQLQSSCRPVTHCDSEGSAHSTACQQFGRRVAAKLQGHAPPTFSPPPSLPQNHLPWLRLTTDATPAYHRCDADRKFRVKFELGSVSYLLVLVRQCRQIKSCKVSLIPTCCDVGKGIIATAS